MTRPLAIDLFTGLHGWAEGLIAEGWRVKGVDIVDMSAEVGEPKPDHFELILADILTVDGAQFADADLIVSSSPCTDYSYMAMPWTRAKDKAAAIRADETGQALRDLNALFDAQFRIQQEASEAKGQHIPMVAENVRGAREWVGRASAWNFGSYYLWGDVPALMPATIKATKVPGFRFDGSGGSFQTAAVNEHVNVEAQKSQPKGWFNDHKLRDGDPSERLSASSSKSPARKAAAAKIAKIPITLSRHIGRVFLPRLAGEGDATPRSAAL